MGDAVADMEALGDLVIELLSVKEGENDTLLEKDAVRELDAVRLTEKETLFDMEWDSEMDVVRLCDNVALSDDVTDSETLPVEDVLHVPEAEKVAD